MHTVMLTTGCLQRERCVSRMYKPEGKESITSLTFTRVDIGGEPVTYLFYTTTSYTAVVEFTKSREIEVCYHILTDIFCFLITFFCWYIAN